MSCLFTDKEFVNHVRKHGNKITCHLSEKLHVLSSPESKARREGQTAAFCCAVAGTPQPDKYQW